MNTNQRPTPASRNSSPRASILTLWSCVLGVILSSSLTVSLAEQVAAPVISPIPTAQQAIDGFSPQPPGSGNPPVTLTMTSATEGATIYYRIRDDVPVGAIPTYLPPYDPENKPVIPQAGTSYVGAMAVKAGMDDSEVIWQAYKVHMPVIELVGYMSFGNVDINTTSEKQLSIYNRGDMDLTISSIGMETDDPGVWSHNLTDPIVLLPSRVTYLKVTLAPTEVKQYAVTLTLESDAAAGVNIRNASGNGFDPTKVAPVTITASKGEPYYTPVEIWLYSATAGSTVHYTIDGTDPTEASALYDHADKPMLSTLGDVVVKARGYKDGLTSSEIATRTFSVVEKELTASQDFFWVSGVKVGSHEDQPLVLENVGSRPIEITNIVSDSINLTVNFAGPVTIPVGGTQNYAVRFAPKERFDLFGTFTIFSNANGGDIVRYWNGFGLPSGYGLDPEERTVSREGETYTVWVDSAAGFPATESLDWISVLSNELNQMFVVTVDPNTTGVAREGTVTLGDLTHTIKQAAAVGEGIDPTTKEIAAVGGDYTIEVNISTEWSVTNLTGFVEVDPMEGSGSGSVSVTVYPNPNTSERDGSIAIGGYTHTIAQVAATEEQYELVEPQFSPDPDGGPFAGPLNVSLTLPTLAATIRYTTDPSDLEGYRVTWPKYNPEVPIVIDETTTIRAWASKAGFTIGSETVSATFVIGGVVSQVASPQFSPNPATGPFDESVSVSLTTTTEGATIRYTFTEGAPSESWTAFAAGTPIVLEETKTIWTYASKSGASDSEVVSATYTVAQDPSRVVKPTLDPDASSGPFVGPQEIQFASTTEGATLLYTHDESALRESWITADSVKLYYQAPVWVMGIKDEMTDSLVAHGLYRIRASYSGTVKIGPLEVAKWTIVLEADGSGVLQVFPAEGDPIIFDILIGVDGSISATLREYAEVTEDFLAASPMSGSQPLIGLPTGALEASIGSDGTITGSYGDLGSVEGSVDPVNAFGEGTCGVYEVPMLYTDAGVCHVLVGTDGKVSVIIVTPSGIEVCKGQLDGEGHVTMTTTAGGSAEVTVAADRTLTMELTPVGADEPIEFSGLSAGEDGVNRLVNLSTRGHVGLGAQNMIAGFVITGSVSKPVLIRAMGPTLSESFGMTGTVADPMIEVIPLGGSTVVASNDDWENTQTMLDAIAATGAFAAHAVGSKDAMLLAELEPGGYTATISGVGETEGVAIVEVYAVDDLATPEARQVNISTRGYIGAGDSVMIMGLVASGNTPRQFLIRAVGPTLSDFGIAGVLEDPVLRVVRSTDQVEVATNDDWDTGPGGDAIEAMAVQLGAFALPRDSKDAVLLISLPPTSPFTVVVEGKDGATGVAIAEVYEVP